QQQMLKPYAVIGYLLKTFKGHRSMVSDIAINTENTLLASASTDGSIRIWNLKTGEPRAVFMPGPQGREKGITAVRFSPSPIPEIRFLAATCDNGLCYLYRWNRESLTFDNTPITIDCRTKSSGNISSFAFNHTGSRLAIATSGGHIAIYSTIAGSASASSSENAESTVEAASSDSGWGEPKLIARIEAHYESITTLVFSANGEMFVTGSLDGTVKVWRCAGTNPKWWPVTVDVREPVPDLEDSPPLVVEGQDEDINQNTTAPAAPAPAPAVPEPSTATTVESIAVAAQEAALVTTETADLASETIANLETLIDSLTTATPEGAQLATHGMPSVASVSPIDVDAIDVDAIVDEPVVTAAPLSSDQAPVPPQTAATDSELAVPAESASGTQPSAPSATQNENIRVETNQVAWICDSSRIIASNNVGTIFVIDPRSGKIIWRKRSHSIAEIYVLISHPSDPRIAVSGGYDGRAIMWNVENGDILHEFKVGEMLFDGSFSEDGLNFALTSDTGAAMLYGLGPTWAFDDANDMHEQMFANDYTATIMDENHFVADQQTQIPSYLVPHSSIMDFDGRVYRRQRGTQYGLDISVKMDSLRFFEEDAGRRAELMGELAYAHLDLEAAQRIIDRLRKAQESQTQNQSSDRTNAADDIPDAELLLLTLPNDDSDDEEYNEGEEEEDDELEEMDEDDEDGIRGVRSTNGNVTHSSFGRLTRANGESSYAPPVVNPRDRRSALEVLRNRHNAASSRPQRSAYRRPTRRVIGGDDDDDDDDNGRDVGFEIISDDEIDGGNGNAIAGGTQMSLRTSGRTRRLRTGTYSEEETAFDAIDIDDPADDSIGGNQQPGRGRGRGRRGYRGGSNAEVVSSDDEFRPGARTSVTTSSAPTGPRGIRRTGSAASANGTGVEMPVRRRGRPRLSERRVEPTSSPYQTRNRRITSDSEAEDEEQSRVVSPPRSSRSRSRTHTGSATNVGITLNSNAGDYVASPNSTRARRSNRNVVASSPEAESDADETLEIDELPSSRVRNLRSTTNGDAEYVEESDQEDHALTSAVSGRSERRRNHMRVPRSADNSYEYSDESPESDNARGPSTRYSQQKQQVQRSSSRKPGTSKGSGVVIRNGSSSAIPRTNTLYRPTDWVMATAPSTVPYRPQIGDFIVYFKEGHQDFWESPSRCSKLSEKQLPYVANSSLQAAVYGKVVGLRYA
ncbi:hypothetical protein IW150_005048, partial [Coemansia sp. RSA 2607]